VAKSQYATISISAKSKSLNTIENFKSDPSTLHIIDSPSSTMAQPKKNELWGHGLLQLPTTIGEEDLNPTSQELNRIPVIRNLVVFFTSKKHVLISIYIFIKKNEKL
jgi:hypothetical protein